MEETYTVDKPVDAIVAFRPEMNRPMMHTVCYQVHIDPAKVSPGGEFIRFDQFREYTKRGSDMTDRDEGAQVVAKKELDDGEVIYRLRESCNEIHGWKRIDEITILEVLEEFEADQAPERTAMFGTGWVEADTA